MKQLKENIYHVGGINPNMRVFDIIMKTEYGTTYNAYLIKGEKTALIETIHNGFTKQLFDNIAEIIPPEKIDYLIMNHTEPDHSGSIAALAEINPKLTVIGTSAAVKNIGSITNRELNFMTVKTGDSLDLGDGLVLQFIVSPNLHWPDSMFTYLPARKAVFTCDFLGAHYCEPSLTDEYIPYREAYKSAFLNYYNAIFGPFKKFVLDGLQRLEVLDFDMVCPSHGPVLINGIKEAMDSYREWSTPKDKVKNVAVFYVSAYGYTKALADAFTEELNRQNVPAKAYDIIETSAEALAKAMSEASGIAVGSPTINRDAVKPVWDLLSSTDAVTNRGKKAFVFGSYGWSGEACKMLEERLTGLGFKLSGDSFKAVLKPSDADLEAMRARAKEFAEGL